MQINNCTNCPYLNCPRIPPTPTFNTDLAIVGMAPGNEELIQGKPFVGRSGDLLHQTLSKSGFITEPFITNALLCMPPDEKNVNRKAIELCRPRLLQELFEVKPKIILALGNVALASIFNNYKLKIGSIHSKPIQTEWGLVIPIYHPAKILRNPGDYKTFLNGFIYAKELLDKPLAIKDPGKTNYIVVNKENCQALIAFLVGFKILSCDIETTSLKPKAAKILAIGFSYCKNEVVIFPSEFLPDIKPIFDNCQVIYQRGQFDTAVLSENGIETEVDHDTILQHYSLNENEGSHDLKTLARHFLGAEEYKHEMETDLYKYNAKDCDYTLQLCNLFLPLIEIDPNLNKLYYQILIPAINFLRRMSQSGFYVDKDYLQAYKIIVAEELVILKAKVIDTLGKLWDRTTYLEQTGHKSAPRVLNPNSHYQLAWLIYDKLNIIPRIKKKVKRSTDKDVIACIMDKHEGFKWLAKYNVKETFMSTYIKGIERQLDNDNRLRSTFSLQTTVTGRLSSAKPNIQHIPRNPEVKNIFVAPYGKVLIEADYNQLELRLLAYFSKDPFLIECFKQGRDLHDEMSIEIFGERFTKEERVAIKGANFGIVYGRGSKSLSEEFNISISEAQFIIDRWFEKAPLAKKYVEDCEKQLISGIPFITPMGRLRRYGVITGDQPQKNESRNYVIQSTASDLTLLSAIDMEKELTKLDSFIVNIVHDSIIIEAPNNKQKVEKIIDLIYNTMERIPKLWLNTDIPFICNISFGFRWGEMRNKNGST